MAQLIGPKPEQVPTNGMLGTAAFTEAGMYTPIAHVGSGGTQHALVTPGGVPGFMSTADKVKVDAIAKTPYDFGAIGDGVADDYAALLAWFTYLTTNHLIARLPNGTFRYTTALAVPVASRWGFVGDGSETTILLYDGANSTNDILTIGDGTTQVINVCLKGFTLRSNTTMTAGVGMHLKKYCRSALVDVVIDGQDGNGKLWHGIRFNGLDQVVYDGFQIRAQKDGMQVNGLIGVEPKADILLDNFKIASCDVGIRFGGAFGGTYIGKGSIAVCGDGVVVDTTLVAETNREIIFSNLMAIDACTRSGIIVDQTQAGQCWINIPAQMWIASCAQHGIWIKNALEDVISVDGFIYAHLQDGIRISDSQANVYFHNPIFSGITGTAINFTVASTRWKANAPRFLNCPTPWNFTNNRAVCDFAFPVSVQGSRAMFLWNYSGTLDASGNVSQAHAVGISAYQYLNVQAWGKDAGGAVQPLTVSYIDGGVIRILGGAPMANRPYNIFCLVGDQANVGW